MAVKNTHLTVTDMFCGAGGSSQGVRGLAAAMGGGIEVKLAMNHWKLAIETHNTNFPETMHDCTDISACDPRRYPSTDIAVMSPECTTHSPAGGNNHKALKNQMELYNTNAVDPATERSRATMWDVCRFAEYHNYNSIIVENVVEAKTRWVLFDVWLQAMHKLGYDHKCVYVNSMHFWPTPQSRDRMYIVFWKKVNKAPNLEHTPLAHCPQCGCNINAIQVWKNPEKKFGKYKQQYRYHCPVHGCIVEPYYYAAFNCIDWTDLGTRIGDREKPLAPNTRTRINYGLDKYGKEPLILHTMYSDQARGVVRNAMQQPAFAQTSFTSQAISIPPPFIIDDKQTTGVNFRVKSATDSTSTVHTDPRIKLVTMPFVVQAEQTSKVENAKAITESINTQATRQTLGLVTHPFIIDGNFDAKPSRACSILEELTTRNTHQRDSIIFPQIVNNTRTTFSAPATEALPTQTTVKTTGILTTEAFNAFISAYNNGSHCTNRITETVGTVATKERLTITSFTTPNIEDCFYRMLKPGEIKLAMAFEKDYVILGSNKDQVKQCGNAVTPPVMQWLLGQVVETFN